MNTKSTRAVHVLGGILKKKYPNFDPNQAIPLTDLLDWELWPGFIRIHGRYDLVNCSVCA